MTNQEEKVLRIIRDNPTIEQSEIAKLLGIKRSTVAVHISNLQKNGYIMGKGYIVNQEDYVLGIGATNIDIYAKSKIKIRTHYDHPAEIVSAVGGVARNIISNLSRLDVNCKIITAVGNDSNADVIINDFKNNNIDTSNIITVNGDATGIFMQVQDENNDMYIAACDMSVLDHISPEYISSRKSIIRNAKLILVDSSLRDDTYEELFKICKDDVPIYLDPISDNYALKMKPYIKNFTCIKPNIGELENLSGIKINNNNDLSKACKKVLDIGAKKLFVSLGKDGILYMDSNGITIRRKLKAVKNMANASGAGDALMAAILYGTVNELSIEKTIDYGLAAGIASIESEKTINDDMSIELLDRIIKERK